MVMTFTLTPLSHNYSITDPHARFLLYLLEDLSMDFPSHFITSIINVYQDTATHDKLIFPSAIKRILRHSSMSIPDSPYYTTMGAINAGSIRQSKAQLRSKRPQTEMIDPATFAVPSTSAPSLASDVTLKAIMAQLQHMDACLTLSLISCVK